jgi:Holliday junction resolvasome RuvABC endonuclease subunit
MFIRVAGIDPSLRNMGIVRMMLKLDTLETTIQEMELFETEKLSGKTVRQNSDDLRRATELYNGMIRMTADCNLVFAEIPTGAQSARAALSFGIAIGIMSACPIPLIQVQPSETKLATVGTKTASKQEMIEWAGEAYPKAPWLTRKLHGKQVLVDKNEHLADACAIIHAGIKTDEFQRLRSIWLAGK